MLTSKDLSSATASTDLQKNVDERMITKQGDKRTTTNKKI